MRTLASYLSSTAVTALWMVTVLIVAAVLLLKFLKGICFCQGGKLTSGCGRILFPWSKKFKLPDGTYCCKKCLERDLELFYGHISSDKPPHKNLVFTDKEEKEALSMSRFSVEVPISKVDQTVTEQKKRGKMLVDHYQSSKTPGNHVLVFEEHDTRQGLME